MSTKDKPLPSSTKKSATRGRNVGGSIKNNTAADQSRPSTSRSGASTFASSQKAQSTSTTRTEQLRDQNKANKSNKAVVAKPVVTKSATRGVMSSRKILSSKNSTSRNADEEESLLLTDTSEMATRGSNDESTYNDAIELETDLDDTSQRLLTRGDSSGNDASESLLTQMNETHPQLTGVIETPVRVPIRRTSDEVNRADLLNIHAKDSLVIYHDDEEINQTTTTTTHGTLSWDDEEYSECGAALTVDDETITNEIAFVVYPLGCCEIDETQLISANTTRAIQKCILKLSNSPSREESMCWGLGQEEPILMKLLDGHIQFTHLKTHSLVRSQPIPTIKSWAVDDDNNFAFVVEDRTNHSVEDVEGYDSMDYALLNQPTFMCYVFSSLDDDDMSCKVAARLNEEITRYKEQMTDRLTKSTRVQQMVHNSAEEETDADVDDFEAMEASNEVTMNVKYIGSTQVPRPVGIDILNIAIDKCLSDASNNQMSRNAAQHTSNEPNESTSTPSSSLIDAKLHVSPSSVILENDCTGEIIVECRIRYLTFMGISRRDTRWCGFIMQNTNNKTFVAHCIECHPAAGHVCDAIQASCAKMYEKVVKTAQAREAPDSIMSIMPSSSKIRNTLAKTFSRIKLNTMI